MLRSFTAGLLTAVLLAGIGGGSVALAAESTTAMPEEITVTARRKEESLQEVPLSVTAIGTETLQNRGINQIDDLVQLDPSVVLDTGFSAEDVRIAVRGLTNTRGRSNVAFLVDGVDVTSESIASAGASLLVNQRLLGDVERIEIIKGPQSALYGRAAFAGAISYVTRDANLDAVDGNVGLEINDNDLFQLSAGISGPLIAGKLGARVQAITWNEDSFYDNSATGRNLGGSDGYATALTLNWVPSDTLDVKWRISYSDDETASPPQVIYTGDDLKAIPLPSSSLESNGGPLADDTQVFGVPALGKADGRRVYFSEEPLSGREYPGSKAEILRSSLQLNWDVGPGTFTSITGGTDADLYIEQDVDYQGQGLPDTILNNWEFDSKNNTTQISQEFRYATDLDGALNYTGGLLGWREKRDADYRGYIAVCENFEALSPCDSDNWQGLIKQYNPQYGDNGFTNAETRHWSVYGMIEWDVTDRLALSVEARYVNEVFDVDRSLSSPCLLTPFSGCVDREDFDTVSGSVRSDFITPKFLAEYAINDDTMVYASISKGEKPGGITTISSGAVQPLESLSFDPEKLWAYEFGWKTSFDGNFGRLVFNGAAFFQDYTDKQVQVLRRAAFPNPSPPPAFTLTEVPAVENASDAEVFGQELQLTWLTPIDGLMFNFAYTHLDSEYGDYKTETQSAQTIAQVGNCTQVTLGSETFCEVDFGGNELERSPEHTLVTTTSYTRPLFSTGMNILAEADANYTSDRYKSATNYTEIESAWIANIRLGLQADDWSVIGYVDNLFDDDTIVSGGTSTPDFGAGFAIPPTLIQSSQLPRPRVVGVRMKYEFGG